MRILPVLCLLALCISAEGQNNHPCTPTVVGELKVETFPSKVFGDTQTLRIWLPPGYNDSSNKSRHYPVLYMLDGQNLFDACTTAFGTEWRIDETLTRLIQRDSIDPIIVVGVDSKGHDRSDQYLPYSDPMNPYPPEPHGKLFPDLMAAEVVPLINRQYRTIGNSAATGIGGSSYGGAAALYTLLTRPDIFGLGLLESTTLHVGNGELLRNTQSLSVAPPRIYIGVGTKELGSSTQFNVDSFNLHFVHLSAQLAANFKATEFNQPAVLFIMEQGASHNEKAWAGRFERAILFLFPKQK